MKLWAVAVNTFVGLLRNRLIVVVSAFFIGLLLLLLAPLSAMRHHAVEAGSSTLTFIGVLTGLLSTFGGLLAIWATADAVATEIQSGTVLAVLARPLQRWQFLLGKYLGVQLLLAIYVAFLVTFTYAAAALGGAKIPAPVWALIAYPLVRYALDSAMALLFATRLRAPYALGCVFGVMILAGLVSGGSNSILPAWLVKPLYVVLPSTGLLAETRFFNLGQGATHALHWRDHLTILVYGLDYAVLCLFAAAGLFRRRSLHRVA